MRFTSQFILLAVLSSTAAAAPSRTADPEKSIRIPLTASKTLIKRELENYSADIASMRRHIARRTKADDSSESLLDIGYEPRLISRANNFGPVALSPTTGVYHGTVIVGNQNFDLAMDTGSRHMWLFGPDCTGPDCSGHTKYNPRRESAAGGQTRFNLDYVGGSLEGKWYTDTVTIAGVRAPGVSVGAATTVTHHFRKEVFNSDGLVGLGLPDLSPNGNAAQGPQRQLTLMEVLIRDKLIFSNQFSFIFSTHPELVLGYSNILAYEGAVTYMPVLNPQAREWIISLDGVSVAEDVSAAPGVVVQQSSRALIDTGTTLCFGPIDQVRKIYEKVEGAMEFPSETTSGVFNWVIPCDATEIVSLIFGGKGFSFWGETLIFNYLDDEWCLGSISGRLNSDMWVIGPTFLRNLVSIFQIQPPTGGPPRIGFARLGNHNAAADFRALFGFPSISAST